MFVKSLRTRVQAQAWARVPIYFPFGAPFWREPLGFKLDRTRVYDEDRAGAALGNWHRGTDFPLPVGEPVTAALSGMVTYADYSNLGYGKLVTIEGGRYKCRYAHLSEIDVVIGTWAHAGDTVGRSGQTGNVTGPHLHFEVFDKVLQCYVDPFASIV